MMQRLSIDKQHELVVCLVARMAQRHPEASVKRRLMTTESQKQRPHKYIYTQRNEIPQGVNSRAAVIINSENNIKHKRNIK